MDRFNIEMAKKYGAKAAIVAQFIWDSLDNQDCVGEVYEYEGKVWLRCSILMMTGAMPYLSNHMIRDALHILTQERVLKKGSFNYSKYDRTNWYSFTDFGMYMITKGVEINGEEW